ncbi:hypothetical protein [Nocardia cyriacigeorgica]|uniref:hypothetical protein n=1 Tax=Nocardia cyriacigeorgica TaxID=135487 RepID=UPI001894D151|nr:hypothetical protein [Nocardia cyriacigeorgica]MBF6412884.1 hypothetical protein [Nocardia cyriacigeorgica]
MATDSSNTRTATADLKASIHDLGDQLDKNHAEVMDNLAQLRQSITDTKDSINGKLDDILKHLTTRN